MGSSIFFQLLLIYLSKKTNTTFFGLPYTHKTIFTCWTTRYKSKICQMFKEHKYEVLLLKGNSYLKSTLGHLFNKIHFPSRMLKKDRRQGWIYLRKNGNLSLDIKNSSPILVTKKVPNLLQSFRISRSGFFLCTENFFSESIPQKMY